MLDVFPNPTKNSVTVHFKIEKQETISINILNLFGEKVLELFNSVSNEDDFNHYFDVGHLKPGSYILQVKRNNLISNRKLTIIH